MAPISQTETWVVSRFTRVSYTDSAGFFLCGYIHNIYYFSYVTSLWQYSLGTQIPTASVHTRFLSQVLLGVPAYFSPTLGSRRNISSLPPTFGSLSGTTTMTRASHRRCPAALSLLLFPSHWGSDLLYRSAYTLIASYLYSTDTRFSLYYTSSSLPYLRFLLYRGSSDCYHFWLCESPLYHPMMWGSLRLGFSRTKLRTRLCWIPNMTSNYNSNSTAPLLHNSCSTILSLLLASRQGLHQCTFQTTPHKATYTS